MKTEGEYLLRTTPESINLDGVEEKDDAIMSFLTWLYDKTQQHKLKELEPKNVILLMRIIANKEKNMTSIHGNDGENKESYPIQLFHSFCNLYDPVNSPEDIRFFKPLLEFLKFLDFTFFQIENALNSTFIINNKDVASRINAIGREVGFNRPFYLYD